MTEHKEDYSWVYTGIAISIGIIIIYFLFFSQGSGHVRVKYRSDKVDISASNFEPLEKTGSTVKGAWYDHANEYMIIKLGSTYYQYCGMPSDAWNNLKSASSTYKYYQSDIKGSFDCRVYPVPTY